MSQRPKTSQSVALFPFLAVLVCTMGSLIFLLLVTTKMMRNVAIAQAAAAKNPQPPVVVEPQPTIAIPQPEPEPEPVMIPGTPEAPVESTEPKVDRRALELAQRERELEELANLWRKRVDKLVNQRADHARLLQQRKLLQQASMQRLASLKTEATEMEIKLGGMTGELSATTIDNSSKEQIELEKKIAELKKRLLAAQQAQEADGAFQVVPFDVNTGTSRRPILIECTDNGLRFIPEDVMVSAKDLEGFTPQVNPLIAGASSLVNYWSAWNLKQPNPAREPEPYVLLMVRPSGTVAYYVAMKMLSNLKQPHGYELIEEETVLRVPPVDPGSKAACEAAVKRLINERNQVLRAAGQGGFGYGRGGNADAFRGDSIGNRGTGSKGGTKVASSARNASGGPAGGNAAGISGSGSDAATGQGGGAGDKFELSDILHGDGTGKGDWDRVENFEGRPPRGPGSQMADGSPMGSPRGPNGGSPGNSSPSGGSGRTTASGGFRTSPGPNGSPAGSSPPGQSGDLGGGSDTTQNDGSTGEGPPGDPGSTQPGGGQPSGNQRKAAPKGGYQTMKTVSKPGAAGTTDSQDSQSASGIETLDGSVADSNQAGTTERPDIGLGSTNRSPIPVQDLRRKRKKSSDKPIEFEPQQLVSHHWGLSEPGASIGLERELRVDVEPTRFVIAGKHAVTVDEIDSRDNIFDRMVTVLDLQAREWGKPPQGFFWKPSLRFVIAKGGDANYEKVHSLIEQAGLSSTRESADPKADTPVIATAPEKPTPPATAPANPQPTAAPPRMQRRSFWGFSR